MVVDLQSSTIMNFVDQKLFCYTVRRNNLRELSHKGKSIMKRSTGVTGCEGQAGR